MAPQYGFLPSELGPRFTTAEANALGVPRSRLRASDLVAPFHGVRRRLAEVRAEEHDNAAESGPRAIAQRHARTALGKVRAYLPAMAPGAFFCGRTVLALRQLLFASVDDLEVGVIAPRRAPRARGIHGRKVEERLVELELFDGVPVTTLPSTWAISARDLSERELTVLADAMLHVPRDDRGVLRPERAAVQRSDLQAALSIDGRPYALRLASALAQTVTGSASVLESEFRLDAADAGLPEPDLDVEIRNSGGRLLGISELVYPRFRVVVEIEGDHHRTSRSQWNRDIEKYQNYAAEGWEIVRLTSTHIGPGRPGVSILRETLMRRGWRPA